MHKRSRWISAWEPSVSYACSSGSAIYTAHRSSFAATTVQNFEPFRLSDGQGLEASLGSSFSLASQRRMRSSSASMERCVTNCSSSTASERSMKCESTRSAGCGSATRSEPIDHLESCRQVSSRYVVSVNSLHLRLASFEGYGHIHAHEKTATRWNYF
jgi:hypothetical protein